MLPFLGLLILFAVLATGMARTRLVAPNEGWFADPAFHLATKGVLGTTLLETSGTWLEGIERHTYWIFPLHPLALAGIYRIFGFSLFTTRALSIVWGLVAVTAFFLLVRSQTSDKVALLATLLIATDFHFLVAAGVGRMDMMCAALGLSGLAAYMILRERSLRAAILVSHTLAAAACFTHPCGVLAFAGLVLLALRFDRQRLNWRLAALALVPYVTGVVAYSPYALQDWPSFLRQLSGNVNGLAGETTGTTRLGGLAHPWTALKDEIVSRYVSSFVGGSWYDPYRPQILVLVLYWGGAIVALVDRSIRRQKIASLLLSLTALFWVMLWLFEGLKLRPYMIHTLPLCAGLGALWIWNWTEGHSVLRTSIIALVLSIQLLGIGYGVWKNQYQKEYLPTVMYLRQHGQPGSLIMASGEFGFEFGFDGRVLDDVRLGYRSKKRPEFYVKDYWYTNWLEKSVPGDAAVLHVATMLARSYREVYRNPSYTIYQLR